VYSVEAVCGFLRFPTFFDFFDFFDLVTKQDSRKFMTLEAVLPLLACPSSKAVLDYLPSSESSETSSILVCKANGAEYAVREGVPNFVERAESVEESERSELARSFEEKYQREGEPWSYSDRAAEILRHQYVIETTERLAATMRGSDKIDGVNSQSHRLRLLDLGCSNGQLTYRLGQAFPAARAEIFSLDISPTAVETAQKAVQSRAESREGDFFFLAASATELPFAGCVFDIVVVSDGLHGWELPPELQRQVLAEVFRVLKPSGYALFTDYLHPKKYDELEAILRQSPLQVKAVEYLYDRFWYRFESFTRALHRFAPVRAALRSVAFAKLLKRFARLRGKYGSKHICIITQRVAV
jgi:SAM-dependent methyltransferase